MRYPFASLETLTANCRLDEKKGQFESLYKVLFIRGTCIKHFVLKTLLRGLKEQNLDIKD